MLVFEPVTGSWCLIMLLDPATDPVTQSGLPTMSTQRSIPLTICSFTGQLHASVHIYIYIYMYTNVFTYVFGWWAGGWVLGG